MSLSFWYGNLIKSPAVLSASENNAFFPVKNIQDDRATKVYRSNTSSCSVVFDLQTIEEVDSIILIPHPILGWGITNPITIEANATNNWLSPAFADSIGASEIDLVHQIAIKEIQEQSFRFWRLSFLGGSFCEVGKVFIGKKHILGNGRSVDYGWSYQDASNSSIVTNRYGQRFIDEANKQKVFSFNLSNLSRNEVDDFFEIYDFCGITKPFFVRIGCETMINNRNRFSGYVFLNDKPVVVNNSFARYSMQVSLSEAL
jgi:hypothetical protein